MKNVVFWDIKPSSYLTGDTLFLRYRAQPVNLCKICGFHGSHYEGRRLLGYKTQFIPHRRHIISPLQSPASECYVRFDVFTGDYEERRLLGCYTVRFL
jgi:hypothetical protein